MGVTWRGGVPQGTPLPPIFEGVPQGTPPLLLEGVPGGTPPSSLLDPKWVKIFLRRFAPKRGKKGSKNFLRRFAPIWGMVFHKNGQFFCFKFCKIFSNLSFLDPFLGGFGSKKVKKIFLRRFAPKRKKFFPGAGRRQEGGVPQGTPPPHFRGGTPGYPPPSS